MAKKIKMMTNTHKLERIIENEIAEQNWSKDYGLDDMGAVAAEGAINALEWVLEKIEEVAVYA